LTLAETYLKDELKQSQLFDTIESEIKDILYSYDFDKKVFVDHGDTSGEILIGVQEEFPSQLVRDLDEYMGFQCTIEKTEYRIQFKYRIEDEANGKVRRKRKKGL